MEAELYLHKPRFQNTETYVSIKPKKNKYLVTHHFKAGATATETWDVDYYKEMLKTTLTKVKEIKWKRQQEGDDEWKKKELKKKTTTKKKASKK